MANHVPTGSPIAGLRPSTVLFAIVALVGIATGAIVALSLSNDNDQQATITTIVALVTPLLAGLILLLTKADQIHQLVNSSATAQQRVNEEQATRIDQLIRANEALGGAEDRAG